MMAALQTLRTWAELALKQSRAGNNKNNALVTAIISLAELYSEQFVFEPELWRLPAGRTSSFIKFATEALNQVDQREFFGANVAKYWSRLRSEMIPNRPMET
jgi:hypothetical protein